MHKTRYLQAGEITRRLQEEEEAAMGSANAIKKLDAEIKRSKEEVENMDLRRVLQLNQYDTAPNFIQLNQNLTWDCLLI